MTKAERKTRPPCEGFSATAGNNGVVLGLCRFLDFVEVPVGFRIAEPLICFGPGEGILAFGKAHSRSKSRAALALKFQPDALPGQSPLSKSVIDPVRSTPSVREPPLSDRDALLAANSSRAADPPLKDIARLTPSIVPKHLRYAPPMRTGWSPKGYLP